jgi:hypothetical protein
MRFPIHFSFLLFQGSLHTSNCVPLFPDICKCLSGFQRIWPTSKNIERPRRIFVDSSCPVCLESIPTTFNHIQMQVECEILACGHVLHRNCANNCRTLDGRCPICRQSILNTSPKDAWNRLLKKMNKIEEDINKVILRVEGIQLRKFLSFIFISHR